MRRARSIAALATLALVLAVPAAASASWGAIAIEPTSGKVGYARGQDSAAAAKEFALKECGGGKCKVAVWVSNGYGAVVKKKNGVYIAGHGRTKNIATRDARERAHEKAPLVAWVFSGLS
ncbi:MAG TPA: DUF4189 domain-containing protein [Solirubrobacterales bacterium]|nr:DUF4189 domain-containing protein [Solirubrobacterales bacterium]